jgi:hypothetical protein
LFGGNGNLQEISFTDLPPGCGEAPV